MEKDQNNQIEVSELTNWSEELIETYEIKF